MRKIIALFTIVLFSALLWQCTTDHSEALTDSMVSELSSLPAGEDVALAYANLEKMRRSPFFEIVRDSISHLLDTQPEFQEFLDHTGFDVREDINEVYAAFTPQAQGEGDMLVIAVGAYQPDRILAFVTEKTDAAMMTRETYMDHTIYFTEKKNRGFCFVGESHLTMGSERWLKSYLDARQDNAGLDENLKKRLNSIKFKQGAWVSMDPRSIATQLSSRMPGGQLGPLNTVESVAISASVNDLLSIDGTGTFDTAQNAELVRDALKGALATLKLSLSGDRDAVDVVNKIEVTTAQHHVRVTASFTHDDLQKVTRHRPGLAMR